MENCMSRTFQPIEDIPPFHSSPVIVDYRVGGWVM